MNIAQKRQIASDTLNFMNARGLHKTDMYKLSGVSKEYIGEILKPNSEFKYSSGGGKIGDIPDNWFLMLAEAIGKNAEEDIWKPVPTIQLKNILSELEESKKFGYTRVIIGETGSGKTYAVDRFVNDNPKENFKITVGSMDNISDLLDKILDTLKIKHGKSKSKKINDIIKHLKARKQKGENPSLIFDEAEYMKQATLCNVKELHDHLHKYASINLIGTDQLLDKLERLKKKNIPGMPQFYRRIKFGIRELPSIDTTFKSFLNGIEDSGFKKFLQDNCDNYGELHDAMIPVIRESQRTGEPMTERFARKVLQLN
jgi:hypothetical protein